MIVGLVEVDGKVTLEVWQNACRRGQLRDERRAEWQRAGSNYKYLGTKSSLAELRRFMIGKTSRRVREYISGLVALMIGLRWG